MSFVYPGFLFALFALSIPIIVHLFNFKRFRKVYFSDVRFLKDIELQTRQRNQLRHLLVLLTRLLAITFLVLAFAQPVIPTGNGAFDPTQRQVGIYLDNSFSMDAEGENGDLLEFGKQKAGQVGKAYSNAGQLRFYTNKMNAAQGREMTMGEFEEEVSQTVLSPFVRPLSQVIKRISDRSAEDGNASDIYIISDLQKISTDLENITNDTADQISIIPLSTAGVGNLYIDSLWFETPVRQAELSDQVNIRVRNSGDQRKENIPVKLVLNGAQRAIANVTVEPQSFEIIPLSFRADRPGFYFGTVSLTDHPITYDDDYYFSYHLARNIRVLELKGKNATGTIEGIFGNDEDFSFMQMDGSRVDHSAFPNYDLIVVNELEKLNSGLIQELISAMKNSSSVLMIPSMESDPETYNELLLANGGMQFQTADTTSLKVNDLNLGSNLFQNVFIEWKDRIDLPMVNAHFPTNIPNRSNAEVLMQLEGGDELLIRSAGAKGALYVLTTSFDNQKSQLAHHAIIVPTLYNIALLSQPKTSPYQVLGRNDAIELIPDINNDEVLEIRSDVTGTSVIPEILHTPTGVELRTYGQITQAGQYLIMDGMDTLQTVSYNFDRAESNISYYTTEELASKIADLGLTQIRIVDSSTADLSASIKEMHEGKRLWKLFLILALAFLAIEILLLRILS